jgi:hypothetical protein
LRRRKGTRELAAVSLENLPKKNKCSSKKKKKRTRSSNVFDSTSRSNIYVVKETIQQRSEFFSASRDSISLGQIRPQQLFEEETPISSSCPAARDWSSTLILL